MHKRLLKEKKKFLLIPKSEFKLKKLFKLVLYLAILGLILKLLDRFVIRGISLGSDYFENRETMEAGGGNPVAILNSFLTPFGLIPLFLIWKYKLAISRSIKVLAFVLFFAQMFDAILLGSRSIIFVLFILFGLYLFYFKIIKISFIKVLTIISVFIGFMLIMNFIYVERTKLFAGDNTYDVVLNQSNINYSVTASDKFKNDFSNFSTSSKTFAFTYITTVQYFTHGMIEFSYLYENHKSDYAIGSYTFAIYSRFLHKIVGEKLDTDKIIALNPRPGVFNTFFGPIFIDFGWFSMLFMFLFGIIAKLIYDKATNGYDWAILLYFYIFIIVVFSPVFNFINGAGGIFVLTSLILFYFVSKTFYTHEKIS